MYVKEKGNEFPRPLGFVPTFTVFYALIIFKSIWPIRVTVF